MTRIDMTKGPITNLVSQMDDLALATWNKIAYGPSRNVPFREDGITSENLFALDMSHPWLNVMAFTSHQEATNGADWEWWIGDRTNGWIGLRVQAKRIYTSNRCYAMLEHRVGDDEKLQADILIDRAIHDSEGSAPIFPLYCFYNGWVDNKDKEPLNDAEWPDDTVHSACPRRYIPPKCVHIRLRQYGCAISSALTVRALIDNPGRPFRHTSFLPHSIPWSHLFVAAPVRDPDDMMDGTNVLDSDTVVEGATRRAQRLWQDFAQLNPDLSEPYFERENELEEMVTAGPSVNIPFYVEAVRSGSTGMLRELGAGSLPEVKTVAVLDLGRARGS